MKFIENLGKWVSENCNENCNLAYFALLRWRYSVTIRLESIVLKFLPIMLFGIFPIFCLLCCFYAVNLDYAALFSCRKGVLIMIIQPNFHNYRMFFMSCQC